MRDAQVPLCLGHFSSNRRLCEKNLRKPPQSIWILNSRQQVISLFVSSYSSRAHLTATPFSAPQVFFMLLSASEDHTETGIITRDENESTNFHRVHTPQRSRCRCLLSGGRNPFTNPLQKHRRYVYFCRDDNTTTLATQSAQVWTVSGLNCNRSVLQSRAEPHPTPVA